MTKFESELQISNIVAPSQKLLFLSSCPTWWRLFLATCLACTLQETFVTFLSCGFISVYLMCLRKELMGI